MILVGLIVVFGCKSNKNGKSNTNESQAQTVEVDKVETTVKASEDIPKTTNEVAEPLEGNPAAKTMAPFNSESLYGNWQIVSIHENGKKADIPYSEWDMQLQFEEEAENVRIKSPCNSGGCAYTVLERNITIASECGFTEMYCEEEAKNKWERKLIEVLNNQNSIESLTEEQLILNGSIFKIELIRL